MNLALALKTVRLRKFTKREKTQGEVAEEAGISQTYLSQIESGDKMPSIEVIQKLCEIYGVPLELVVWLGHESKDVSPKKRKFFKQLKPIVDSIIYEIVQMDSKK